MTARAHVIARHGYGLLGTAVVVTIGCGRIGFDPIGGASSDGSSALGDGVAGALPPGGETCATAATIMPGVSGSGSLAGATHDVTVPGCDDGPEVVYLIKVPTTDVYTVTVRSTFYGGFAINRMCPPPGPSICGSLFPGLDQSLGFGNQGDVYLFIDMTAAIDTTFQLTVQ